MHSKETIYIDLPCKLHERLVSRTKGDINNIETIICSATGEYLEHLDRMDDMVSEYLDKNNS